MVDEVINKFNEKLFKEKKGRTAITYKKKIDVFIEYLKKEEGLNNNSCRSVFEGISQDQVINSVADYVRESGIKYKATVDCYFSAISIFFEHLYNERHWTAKLFIDSGEKNNLRKEYADKIKELKLLSKEQSQPLSEEDYERLICLCDERIDNVESKDLLKQEGYNSAYTYFTSALATKIVLFTGVKNNILAELPFEAYDEAYNKILINGYIVHLPSKLAKQMRKYVEVRGQLVESDEKTSKFFTNRKGEKRSLNNAAMFYILPEIIGTKKATAVAKYRILQMIEQNIPADIIKQFTGYSNEVFGHCQEIFDEVNGGTGMESKIRRLDSGLRAIGNYDRL